MNIGLSTAATTNSVAIGPNSTASSPYTVAIGNGANAASTQSIAIGAGSSATISQFSTVIGQSCAANSGRSVVIGVLCSSNGYRGISIGQATIVRGTYGIAIGRAAQTYYASNGIAIGNASRAGTLSNSVALGSSTYATNINSSALGPFSRATGANTTAVGSSAYAVGTNSTAVGRYTRTYGAQSVSVGYRCNDNSLSGATCIGDRILAQFANGLHINTRITGSSTSVTAFGTAGSLGYNVHCIGLQVSSMRYKRDIRDIEDVGEKIDQMRAVRFKEQVPDEIGLNSREMIGMLAEELHSIFPEVVTYDKDGITPFSINYPIITAILLKEIQSLRQRVNTLENP